MLKRIGWHNKEDQRMVGDKPFIESTIHWKPAAEALPMTSTSILFSVKNDKSVKVGQYDGKRFIGGNIIQYFYDPEYVLWWAYMPRPPKGE